jgi:hypothetical protein
MLRKPSTDRARDAIVMPVTQGASAPAHAPAAVLFVTDPDTAPVVPIGWLTARYALMPTEAHVASAQQAASRPTTSRAAAVGLAEGWASAQHG